MTTYTSKAYSAASSKSALALSSIPRREPTPRDVQIEILYCGVCHSDLHYARNEVEQPDGDGLSVRARP